VTLTAVHPTAVVDSGAELGHDVQVGPYTVIGPGVQVGDGCALGPHVVLERNVRLAEGVTVAAGAVLGGPPQDTGYRDEETWVEVGPGTVIREHTTINRATAASGVTRVGAGCFLMSYVHVAHDCQIGEGVRIANGTQLSGHVIIEERANLSGLVAVHQFVTIGCHAMIGGSSRIPQDIPPYVKAVGNPVRLFGLNSVGLERAGFGGEVRAALKHAYRLLFNSALPRAEAITALGAEARRFPEVERLLQFVTATRRGVPA
jgi:UDP-N-acetylglucosamine acyltransferase